MRVDYNGISTLENVFNPKNIYLCESVFYFSIEEYISLSELTKMVIFTPENIIYLKNIHLCTSVFQFFLLKNSFVQVDYPQNIHLIASVF